MRNTYAVLILSCLLCTIFAGCGGVSSSSSQPRGQGTIPASSDSGLATATGAPANGSPVNASAQPNSTTLSTGETTAAPGSSSGAGTSNVKADLPAITLHLAGDSTVMNYAATTVQEGWGQELGQFFTDKVTVDNKAIGGANVKSFKGGNWSKIMAVLEPGDYVLIQFGTNDSGTAHGPVTPTDFAATLGQMADEVRAKGATPIFVTPSALYQWRDGAEDNSRLAPYAAAMITQGAATNVLVDDLNARGVELLNSIGQTAATPLYLPSRGTVDKAHFLKAGATQMARFVAEELRRINSPLATYLK